VNHGEKDILERVVILAAMDIEVEAILKKLPLPQPFSLHEDLRFPSYRSKAGKYDVVLVRSGVGIVNGALATSYAIDRIKPTAVILLGVAGALVDKINVGTTIVAHQILQHDAISSCNTTTEFMAPGELHVSLPIDQRLSPWIKTDAMLSDWISNQLSALGSNVRKGTILSGSEFVGDVARKRKLASIVNDALAVEMEAAGVIQVTQRRKVPLVVIKTIADRFSPDVQISSDYLTFINSAAATAAHTASVIINSWDK
jgi:adenosylhomocysteine nucleosidase